MRTPSARSWCSIASVALVVLQQHRFGDLQLQPAAPPSPRPRARGHAACTRLRLLNWTAERLTATLTWSGQLAASAQACRSTHSPIGTIRPVSSATGMNSAGETMPRSGWCQRNSASKPHDLVALAGRPAAGSRARTRRWRAPCADRVPARAAPACARPSPARRSDRCRALRLGAVEREVGVLQQLVRLVAVVGRDGDADAGADRRPDGRRDRRGC